MLRDTFGGDRLTFLVGATGFSHCTCLPERSLWGPFGRGFFRFRLVYPGPARADRWARHSDPLRGRPDDVFGRCGDEL